MSRNYLIKPKLVNLFVFTFISLLSIGLINSIGMKGWHAGMLANSAAVEAMTSVLISINRHHSISHSGIKVTGLKD